MIKLIVILLLSLSLNLSAQNYGSFPKIDREKLILDLDLLYQGLDKFHSGMYWYTSKDSVKQAFANAKGAIDRDLDILQFHKIIAPLVSLSREDHTDIFLPESAKIAIRKEGRFMPLLVVFLGDELYCLSNRSGKNIDVVGKKILSINDKNPIEIVDKINQLFATDGYIKEVKKKELSGFGFARYYCYYFGNLPFYKVEFEDRTVEFNSLSIEAIRDNVERTTDEKQSLEPNKECLEFRLLDNNIAYLGVRDFDNSTIKENNINNNYKAFLSNSFRKINEDGIKHLILDLSKNGGGSEGNENLLYSYLGANYKKYIKVKAKTQEAVLDNGIDSPITLKTFGLFERWFFNKRMKDGSYERKNKPGIGLMAYKKEPKYKFADSLYVLISPITYSGASELSNMLYSNNIGTFIGQETGGGYYGNTSGYSQTLELPHSKIQIKIPALKFEMNVEDIIPFGRGVIPHHNVIPTFEQYVNDHNAALSYALKLVAENKTR